MKTICCARRYKMFRRLVTFSVISLLFATICAASLSAQDTKERIVTLRSFPAEPIEIIDLKTAQKSIKIDEVFKQDADWLKGFTIRYKNISGKNIIWLNLALDFPETRATGNIMAYTISSGPHPYYSGQPRKPGEPTLSLIPVRPVQSIKSGETIELTLDPVNYQRLVAFVGTRHSLNSLSNVALRINFIIYEDGTGWAGENVRRSDPNNSDLWKPYDPKMQE